MTSLPLWVRAYLTAYRKPLISALTLGLVGYACSVLLMFASGYLISKTAEAGMFLMMVMTPIACVQLFGIGKPVAHYFERIASHDWVFRVTSDLRRRLFESIERQTTATENDQVFGEVLSMLAEDIGHLQNLYLRVVFPTIIAYAFYALVGIALGCFSIAFAFAELLLLGTVTFIVPPMLARAIRARSLNARRISEGLYGDLTDNVMGATDWVVSGRGASYAHAIATASAQLRDLEASVRNTKRIVNTLTLVLIGGAIWLAVIWAGGAFGAAEGNGNSAMIAAFAFGFFPLIEVFGVLNEAAALTDPHLEAVDRLDGVLGDEQTDDSLANDQPSDTHSEEHTAQIHSVASTQFDIAQGIVLDDVCFTYPDSPIEALSHVTLSIGLGDKLAILGKSGAGKTTLSALIHGDIAPTSGKVNVFGHNASGLGEETSRAIAYIGQSPYLFNRTLRDNLTLGAPDATDEELVATLEQVGLGELLNKLPHGLDTLVDEAGTNFSGGERHRIALARVLLSRAPAVIIDEPTIGLDPATEARLFDTFFNALSDQTLIVIMHHLAHVERFDRVVLVENNTVALEGAPRTLLATNERFAALLQADRA